MSESRILGGRVECRSRETTWALADHPYSAPPPQATRRRHGSLPTGALPARWTPVMQASVEPPTKRRRLDTETYQFGDGARNSGDSFHTPDTAVYYTPPDAREVTSTARPLDPIQSWLPTIARKREEAVIASCPSPAGRAKEHSYEPF